MKVVTDNKHYNDIADAIREKTGTENTYTPAEMASGVNEVYEAGKKAEYDEFWDVILDNGKRSEFSSAFAYWKCEYLRPTQKVKAGGLISQMFRNNPLLRKVEREYFDLSNATTSETSSSGGNYFMFSDCPELEEIEDIGLKSAYYHTTFADCPKLKRIAVVRSTEDTMFNSTFRRNTSLKEIEIEGVIGKNISFSFSPLTVESMKSIITHLKDYSGTTSEYTYTVTFKTSAFEELEAEGTTAEYNGTPCTWAELIGFLKWNLVKA